MKPYADTNFLTRLYLGLDGAATAQNWLKDAMTQSSPPIPITWLGELEMLNAVQRCVYVTRTEGRLRVSPEFADAVRAEFQDALSQADFIQTAALPYTMLRRQFENLVLRHTAKHGFRTYDVLHVASAMLLGCDTFWSFDIQARRLAELEGLHVPKLD
jgi:predicted nucleic acid-binding protein